jgi:hypothetical protein
VPAGDSNTAGQVIDDFVADEKKILSFELAFSVALECLIAPTLDSFMRLTELRPPRSGCFYYGGKEDAFVGRAS